MQGAGDRVHLSSSILPKSPPPLGDQKGSVHSGTSQIAVLVGHCSGTVVETAEGRGRLFLMEACNWPQELAVAHRPWRKAGVTS